MLSSVTDQCGERGSITATCNCCNQITNTSGNSHVNVTLEELSVIEPLSTVAYMANLGISISSSKMWKHVLVRCKRSQTVDTSSLPHHFSHCCRPHLSHPPHEDLDHEHHRHILEGPQRHRHLSVRALNGSVGGQECGGQECGGTGE